MDVVFLAFANDPLDPLPTLSEEDDNVFSILVNRSLKGDYLIHRDSFTTLEKINDYLGRYRDRLAVVLYSGHADRQSWQLGDERANALGIAHQLGKSAQQGKLQLVILNGCSTAGQVEALLQAGVPAVVATSAPVGDKSAAAFSRRFFHCLAEKRMTIRDAFEEALGPAQTSTTRSLEIENISRGQKLETDLPAEQPLWGLYTQDDVSIDRNPLPVRSLHTVHADFIPNQHLTSALFETLYAAGNRVIRNLYEQEETEYVEIGAKQTAIVNVLPFPVAIHLQKLLCPVEEESEGFDKISTQRLAQIGIVYQAATELLAYIMLAQMWELRLQEVITELPVDLQQKLRDYFYLSPPKRATYDRLELVRAIHHFLKDQGEGAAATYFVDELAGLSDHFQEDHSFDQAGRYLHHLHRQAAAGQIPEEDVAVLCAEAEQHLSAFFQPLGWLHHYTLASVQGIDLERYRHQRNVPPVFSHRIVKLMRAFGRQEQLYYQLSDYLDNRGVVLLKGKVKLSDAARRHFTAEQLEYLNLSPFIIDRNAFEEKSDLADLVAFDAFQQQPAQYIFKNIKRPTSTADQLIVRTEDAFRPIHWQMDAFRQTILNEKAPA